MVDEFHKHIRSSLADANLQIALDANAEKRINARLQAITSTPEDWGVLRQRAHNVRLNTIENADVIYFVNTGEVTRAGSLDEAVDMLMHGKMEN